jgi:hypothetical protein
MKVKVLLLFLWWQQQLLAWCACVGWFLLFALPYAFACSNESDAATLASCCWLLHC